jgi:type II secretory pathway pseudopilin PulG
MYRIIGGDGKEYGPVSAEQIQQWLKAGRVDALTKAAREGTTDWRPIGEFPELMPAPYVEAQTDGKAIGSLVCGILSVTILSCLAGIPAIILGHMSRSAIRKSLGQLKGEGMALAGLILGYVSLAIIPVILIIATISIPSLLRSRQAANESAAVANLRTINTAEVTYLSVKGGTYGDLDALIESGLLDTRFNGGVSGYDFHIVTEGGDYTATATPASSNTGRFGYYTTPDGVVRYSTEANLAPAGQAGLPVQ